MDHWRFPIKARLAFLAKLDRLITEQSSGYRFANLGNAILPVIRDEVYEGDVVRNDGRSPSNDVAKRLDDIFAGRAEPMGPWQWIKAVMMTEMDLPALRILEVVVRRLNDATVNTVDDRFGAAVREFTDKVNEVLAKHACSAKIKAWPPELESLGEQVIAEKSTRPVLDILQQVGGFDETGTHLDETLGFWNAGDWERTCTESGKAVEATLKEAARRLKESAQEGCEIRKFSPGDHRHAHIVNLLAKDSLINPSIKPALLAVNDVRNLFAHGQDRGAPKATEPMATLAINLATANILFLLTHFRDQL